MSPHVFCLVVEKWYLGFIPISFFRHQQLADGESQLKEILGRIFLFSFLKKLGIRKTRFLEVGSCHCCKQGEQVQCPITKMNCNCRLASFCGLDPQHCGKLLGLGCREGFHLFGISQQTEKKVSTGWYTENVWISNFKSLPSPTKRGRVPHPAFHVAPKF